MRSSAGGRSSAFDPDADPLPRAFRHHPAVVSPTLVVRPHIGRLFPQPGEDIGHDLRSLGLVERFVTQSVVDPTLHIGQGAEQLSAGRRDNGVGSPVRNEGRQAQPGEVAASPLSCGEQLGAEAHR